MDFPNYIVNCITQEIPKSILSRAFASHNPNEMYTIEDRIYQEVVMDRVYFDTNMLGGEETHILLDGLEKIYTDNSIIVRLPANRRNGKRVLSVLSIDMPYTEPSHGGLMGVIEGPVKTSSTNVRLSGINTIETTDNLNLTWLFLRCRVGDEPNFQNWNIRYIPALAEMCVLACKMIVYTRLNDTIGDGTNNAGSVNSYMRSTLDGYADAAEMYRTFLRERYRKISILKDHKQHLRSIDTITPGLF